MRNPQHLAPRFTRAGGSLKRSLGMAAYLFGYRQLAGATGRVYFIALDFQPI